MKVTVGDVINNKVNVRDYMTYDEETKRIFVDGNALDVVLIDKSDEWQKLKDENRRYKQALEYYANNHTWHIDKINEVARKVLDDAE